MTTDEQTTDESWHEVGRQFKALGESLATAFRTAWESEENRQHLESMKTGLEAMVNQVGQAIQEASASPQGQKVRVEVERAAESARAAGAQALQDARPHLLSALRQVNVELQKVISRLEQKAPTSGGPASGSTSGVE
jgi:hypothetical protein